MKDGWKVSPRQAVNLGLRYGFAIGPVEAGNQFANFNPATGQIILAGSGSIASRTLVPPDKIDWATPDATSAGDPRVMQFALRVNF